MARGWCALACAALLLAAAPGAAAGASIPVGGDQGWSLGVQYRDLTVAVGDSLVFSYIPGAHDVWQLPSGACLFAAPGAALLGAPEAGELTWTAPAEGRFFFGCSISGHCDAGMLLAVNVVPPGSPLLAAAGAVAAGAAPAAGGLCSPPAPVPGGAPGLVSVTCRSSPVALRPGDVALPILPLPNPYPPDADVAVRAVSSEIVDAAGRSVPLSEVYLHHAFGDLRLGAADGAESRGAGVLREPLPPPYVLVVAAGDLDAPKSRVSNLHFVDTRGVAPPDVKPCIECWCEGSDPDAPFGSVGCCRRCPTSREGEGATDYFLQYTVQYEPVPADVVRAEVVTVDVAGGVEHTVRRLGPGKTDVSTAWFAADVFCPQAAPFQLLRCNAHQHIGGRCIRLYDDASGALLCESCPRYGTGTAPGDEAGYLVGMTATTLDPPATLRPGQRLRAESVYDASAPYAAVMSLLSLTFAGLDGAAGCGLVSTGAIRQVPEAGAPGAALAALQAAAARVPKTCAVRPYFAKAISPCLEAALFSTEPAALASTAAAAGAPMLGMDARDSARKRCCAALEATPLDGLQAALLQLNSQPGCLCPVGSFLKLAADANATEAVLSLPRLCGGSLDSLLLGSEYALLSPAQLSSAFSILLNTVFVPRCPGLEQEDLLAAAAVGGAAGGAAGAAAGAAAGGGARALLAAALGALLVPALVL